MVFNFCTKVLDRLSVKPDKIFLGPGFHKDLERLGQSREDSLFGRMGDTEIHLDPALQGRRIKISVNGKERTFNYKTFIRNDNVEF